MWSPDGLNDHAALSVNASYPERFLPILMGYKFFSYPAWRTNKHWCISLVPYRLAMASDSFWVWALAFVGHCCSGFVPVLLRGSGLCSPAWLHVDSELAVDFALPHPCATVTGITLRYTWSYSDKYYEVKKNLTSFCFSRKIVNVFQHASKI